jgi:hypothetical protein
MALAQTSSIVAESLLIVFWGSSQGQALIGRLPPLHMPSVGLMHHNPGSRQFTDLVLDTELVFGDFSFQKVRRLI